MRKFAFVILPLLAACLGAFAGSARSEEKKGRWMLDLQHGDLRVAAWPDAAGRTTPYHYITLKVTNNTAYAREWRPVVRAIVNTKPGSPTYAMPLVEALDTIRRQERDPKLVPVNETAGLIQPGETKSCVAIFGRLDPMYHRVNVQIGGLVNPVVVYKVEKYPGDRVMIGDSAYYDRNQKVLEALRKEAKEASADRLPSAEVEYQEFLEDRQWDIEYTRVGDEFRAEDSMIRFQSKGWKIIGNPTLLRVIGKQA